MRVQARDFHLFAREKATGERAPLRSVFDVPDAAVAAVTIPTEIAARDGRGREKLKTAQQIIILWHCGAMSKNLNRNQPLIWLEEFWR